MLPNIVLLLTWRGQAGSGKCAWSCYVSRWQWAGPSPDNAWQCYRIDFWPFSDFGHNPKTAVSPFLLLGPAQLWYRVIFLVTQTIWPKFIKIISKLGKLSLLRWESPKIAKILCWGRYFWNDCSTSKNEESRQHYIRFWFKVATSETSKCDFRPILEHFFEFSVLFGLSVPLGNSTLFW